MVQVMHQGDAAFSIAALPKAPHSSMPIAAVTSGLDAIITGAFSSSAASMIARKSQISNN